MLSFSVQNLLRREPLKLVDGGESQRTFVYIKDAIEAVHLMIVCYILDFLFRNNCQFRYKKHYHWQLLTFQENPARANGHIFNVGNPNNEVTVRQLAEMMTKVILFSLVIGVLGMAECLDNGSVLGFDFLWPNAPSHMAGICKSKWRRFNRDPHHWCKLQRVLRWRLWWQWQENSRHDHHQQTIR